MTAAMTVPVTNRLGLSRGLVGSPTADGNCELTQARYASNTQGRSIGATGFLED